MSLIDREELIKECNRLWNAIETPETLAGIYLCREAAENAPEAEAVTLGAYKQLMWERDMAISQLEEHGIPFGGKADVQAVRHGKWLKFDDNGTEYQTCSECNYDMQVGCGADSWCPACGALMDGDNENGQVKQSE